MNAIRRLRPTTCRLRQPILARAPPAQHRSTGVCKREQRDQTGAGPSPGSRPIRAEPTMIRGSHPEPGRPCPATRQFCRIAVDAVGGPAPDSRTPSATCTDETAKLLVPAAIRCPSPGGPRAGHTAGRTTPDRECASPELCQTGRTGLRHLRRCRSTRTRADTGNELFCCVSVAEDHRFRTLHRQDQGIGRRHRGDRQPGPRIFALLLKASADAGLKVSWYTYYAGGSGVRPPSSRPTSSEVQVGEGNRRN